MVNLFNNLKIKILSAKNWFLKSSKVTKIAIVLIILILIFGYTKTLGAKSSGPQYQTAQVQRGTLIQSVTASGNISSSDSVTITTQATGVVNNVYVSDGEEVTKGQKIADLTLDQNGEQNQAQAYASYLSAISSLKSAQDSQQSADASMYTAQQAYLTAQDAQTSQQNNSSGINPATNNPYTANELLSIVSNVTGTQKAFNAAQQKYLDSSSAVSAAQASLNANSISYQEASSTIVAPATGTITNLNLAPGVAIVSQSNSSSSNTNAASSQTVGNISVGEGSIQALVNLSEVDVTSVRKGQKATITLDAYPNKTFTGTVVAIDTNGVVSSGVTNYPTTISIDSTSDKIYLNMATSATIITKVDDDVLTVPNASVQTTNGSSTVRVLKNGQVTTVDVVVGDSSDTDTVITSGLNEGDTVITGEVSTQPTSGTGTTTSPFSGTRGFGGGFGGGGNVRVRTGGGG